MLGSDPQSSVCGAAGVFLPVATGATLSDPSFPIGQYGAGQLFGVDRTSRFVSGWVVGPCCTFCVGYISDPVHQFSIKLVF